MLINFAFGFDLNDTGPDIRITSAPSSIAASANAYPIFPELLFDIYLTGSICSRVGPAVIVILMFCNLLLITLFLMKLNIFKGSSILPSPTSPHACSPDAGPIKYKSLWDNIFKLF